MQDQIIDLSSMLATAKHVSCLKRYFLFFLYVTFIEYIWRKIFAHFLQDSLHNAIKFT